MHRRTRRRTESRPGQLDLVLPIHEGSRLVGIALRVGRRRIPLALRDSVHVQQSLAHVDRVAGHSDQALHQCRRRVPAQLRLVGLIRRHKDHDLAALGIGITRQIYMRKRQVWPVHELVHEEPVRHEQRRDHAARWNPKGLHQERLDHEIDQDRARERLDVLP